MAFTILFKTVPFTGRWPRRPETGIKVGFEEMEHKFPFGTFCPEKEGYLLRCSFAPGKFLLERCVPFTFQLDFPKTFCKWLTTKSRTANTVFFY